MFGLAKNCGADIAVGDNKCLRCGEIHLKRQTKGFKLFIIIMALLATILIMLITNKNKINYSSNNNILSNYTDISKSNQFISEDIKNGEKIFLKAKEINTETSIYFHGEMFPDVKLALCIQEDYWTTLSKDEKEYLLIWLKSMIPSVKDNPNGYTVTSKDSRVYHRVLQNIRQMRNDAFVVFTMTKQDGKWVQHGTVAENPPRVNSTGQGGEHGGDASKDNDRLGTGQFIGAFNYAKDYVRASLKAPSSAKFCSMFEAKMSNLHGNVWEMSGYVDAQNSFGATTRTDWFLEIAVADNCGNYSEYKCFTLVKPPKIVTRR